MLEVLDDNACGEFLVVILQMRKEVQQESRDAEGLQLE